MSRRRSHEKSTPFFRRPRFIATVLDDDGMRTPPPIPPPTPQVSGKMATINDDIIIIAGKMIVFRR